MFKLVLMFLALTAISCGPEYYDDRPPPYYNEKPQPKPDTTWTDEIKPIVDSKCTPCHENAAFVKSGSAYKASAAKGRIDNGTMPPPGSNYRLSEDEKETLLSY